VFEGDQVESRQLHGGTLKVRIAGAKRLEDRVNPVARGGNAAGASRFTERGRERGDSGDEVVVMRAS
jgi:hypothetical protein